MARQRCICGQSSRMPLCDGAHRAEGWTCRAAASPVYRFAFVATPHYLNLADRLAHELGGIAVHRARGQLEAEEVVGVCQVSDSTSLVGIDRVRAQRRRLMVVGSPGPLIAPEVAEWPRSFVPDSPMPGALWQGILDALGAEHQVTTPAEPPSVFLSHAVADEARIESSIQALRALGARVFSCGDSLRTGERWRERIVEALRGADRLLLVTSRASRESSWCAFEVGLAVGLEKPIDVVSIDGSAPPSFIGHQQMADLPRIQARQPWLDEAECFVEATLRAWRCGD